MAYQDIYNNTKEFVAVPSQAIASDTDTVGVIVDTLGFEAYNLVLATGAVTAGNVVINKIEEGDAANLSDAADIPAARLFNTPTAISAANTTDALGFLATKRYVRATITTAGTANLLAGAMFVLADPQNATTR